MVVVLDNNFSSLVVNAPMVYIFASSYKYVIMILCQLTLACLDAINLENSSSFNLRFVSNAYP